MRTGLLIPISNNALAFAFVAAIIFTLLWLIYHAIINSNKNQIESDFNKASPSSDRVSVLGVNDINDLFARFPNRNINIDAETKVFWTSENPLSIAIAQANTNSPLKVYVRINASARELGHRISICSSETDGIHLKLTAESLIFSDQEKSFYSINSDDFSKLLDILRRQEVTINQKLPISENDASTLSKWIEKIIQIQSSNSKILILGK